MLRSARRLAFLALLPLLVPALADATLRPRTVEIRWLGDLPAPARDGAPFSGRLEIVAGQAGMLEEVRVEGPGWTVEPLRTTRAFLARGARRVVEFRAVPTRADAPLEIAVTFDGQTVRRPLNVGAAAISRATRGGKAVFTDGAPLLGPEPSDRIQGGQIIRFRGRVEYVHDSSGPRGADSIWVQIMDDDSPDPFDEAIWEGYTDIHGNFDVTVNWDDCDISGCDDPDIYVRIATENPAIDVHETSVLQTTYSWSTDDQTIEDYTGSDVQFGVLQPDSDAGAMSVWNGIRRAWRQAWQRGGMPAPWVEVFWPSTDGTYYDLDDAIFVASNRTWNEGTHAHEFGHHLHDRFGILQYDNGSSFCGTGHCIWCPESVPNAFAEGFANWFAYSVNAQYVARYGFMTWSAINDGLYSFESLGICCDNTQGPGCLPGTAMPDSATEGYIAALMEDMEDATNDDHDGGAADCDMDAMSIGDTPILSVLREDDPTTIRQFIAAFRNRYPEHDQDFWSTTRNVLPAFGFPVNPPLVTSPPPAQRCHVARAGNTVILGVEGNGQLLQYRWRRNGVDLNESTGFTGTQTRTLVLAPTDIWMNGTYHCLVSTCDGTYSVLSLPFQVSIQNALSPRTLVSWGSNGTGQVGDGTTEWRRGPTLHENLADMVKGTGGASFSIALKATGEVYSWGQASGYGELGNGAYSAQVLEPAPVPGLTNVLQIASGDLHTLALGHDGTVRGWGWNGYGQVGDNTQNAQPSPVVATALSGCVRAVACGAYFSLALMADGTVHAWGSNEFGTLGRGTTGGWSLIPQTIPGLTDVVAISACGHLAMALRSDGTVWTWGTNGSGALGIGVESQTTTHSAVPVQVVGLPAIHKITAGWYSGFAISEEGGSYSWGSNQYGLLGCCGSGATHRTVPGLMSGLILPREIIAGWGGFGAAIEFDGRVKVWGYNANWPLGREYPTSSYLWTPVEVEGVSSVTALGNGWNTVHAAGILGAVTATLDPSRPLTLALSAAPNPSWGATRLAFDLPRQGPVRLAVYDISGRRIRTLVDETRNAGRYVESWDGRVEGGHASLAGVYFVRLEADNGLRSERVVRLR